MADIPLASGIPVHCAHHALVSVHDLKPRPGNPNTHPDRQLVLYAAAIKAHGWREAITVSTRSGFIVTGHGALLAARKLGVDTCPVEYQGYESDAAELADVLAHNRLPELSVTDRDLLKTAIAELAGVGAEFVTGFTADDIAQLLERVAPAPLYPITPKLNESHDFLVIYCDNASDWQFLKNLAGVRVEQSYKNATVGEGRVRHFGDFLQSLRENLHSISPARGLDLDASAAQ